MDVNDVVSVVENLPDPSLVNIGRLLYAQGAVMQKIGLEMLSVDDKSMKRVQTAIALLKGASDALARASEYCGYVGGGSGDLLTERARLIEIAYEKGYEIAFECEGRVSLEKAISYTRDCNDGRKVIETF